jgi:TPP-dependent pyruvate/acetoin dehydrogenase alpha subunit
MSKAVRSKRAITESVSHENPLVPYRRMKQMYEGMVELHLLEAMLRKRHKKTKHLSTRGQEACRVSALIGLEPDDLVSDVPHGIGTAFLRGAHLESVVAYADAVVSGKRREEATAKLHLPGLLPSTEKTADRLKLAAGVALALRRLKLSRMVVVFTTEKEIRSSAGKKTLQLAVRELLPMLFVVFPASIERPDKKAKQVRLCTWATAAGVPGMPVDASDAVALYRLVQESIGRLRGGGGPALMECVAFAEPGSKQMSNDAATMMGQTLLDRKVCDEQWLADVSSAFEARLAGIA